MTFPQQQPRPSTARTPIPYRAQQPAPLTGQAGPAERIVIVQMPADQPTPARYEPTAADVAAVRGAVRRDAAFFVLLLVGVMLAAAALAALRWAANATAPAPAVPATAVPATAPTATGR
ncbi:hypothetical protein GCM10009759_71120 [Kitasatospora saccharophila]|uniref:Uncharacterized protein n=1 Tax=Kitasatospora saccharophila TaxID=407973 RepID=A0ABN2Y4M8_9ACTN